MSIVINATPLDPTANSFVAEAQVIAYAQTRVNVVGFQGPSALTDAERAAVCDATRELSMRPWAGRRTTFEQALSWPRWSVVNPDSPLGLLYDSFVMPQRVMDATCELAFEFIKAGTVDIAALDPKIGILSEQVDVLKTQYAPPGARQQGLRRFPRVWILIAPLLDGSMTGATNISRG